MWISSCSFGDVRTYSADPDATHGGGSVGIPSPPDFKGFKHSSDSTSEVVWVGGGHMKTTLAILNCFRAFHCICGD